MIQISEVDACITHKSEYMCSKLVIVGLTHSFQYIICIDQCCSYSTPYVICTPNNAYPFAGLGFSIAGGHGNQHVLGDDGIFTTKVIPGGAAEEDATLAVGNRIMQVGVALCMFSKLLWCFDSQEFTYSINI